MDKVTGAVKQVAGDVVEPFKDVEDLGGKDKEKDKDGKPKEHTLEPLWFGPKVLCNGWVTIAIYGPLQALFIFFAIIATGLLAMELALKDNPRAVRIVTAVGFFFCSVYLVWLGKAIYILQMFRREIGRLAACNEEYEQQNEEHKKLNSELSAKLEDLGKVEQQLNVLANECAGSVEQARALLTRLEGSVKLNAVSSVFVFYDKADRNHDGKIGPNEIDLFVSNLGFLFNHLPGFKDADIAATLKEQGGMTMEQVHDLVDALMMEDEKGRKNFGKTFKKKVGGDAGALAAATAPEPPPDAPATLPGGADDPS